MSFLRILKAHSHNAFDFWLCILFGVPCAVAVFARSSLSEIDAAREFANNQNVQAVANDFIFERTSVFELLKHNSRSQVCEHLHSAAKPQKSFFRSEVRRQIVPFRSADCAEKDCVAVKTDVELVFRKRFAKLIDCSTPCQHI